MEKMPIVKMQTGTVEKPHTPSRFIAKTIAPYYNSDKLVVSLSSIAAITL